MALDEWVVFLDLQKIPAPDNDHCLYYALRHALAQVNSSVLPAGTSDEQTKWVKEQLLELLITRMPEKISSEQVDIPSLFCRYVGTANQEELSKEGMIIEVTNHLRLAMGFQVTEALPRQYWGGTDELRMAALLFGVDVYVLDSRANGLVYVVKYTASHVSSATTATPGAPLMFPLTMETARIELLPALRARTAILLSRTGNGVAAYFDAQTFKSETTYMSGADSSQDCDRGVGTQDGTRVSGRFQDATGFSHSMDLDSQMSDDFGTPPSQPSSPERSVAEQQHTDLVRRMLGTKNDINRLTAARKALRRERQKVNSTEIGKWYRTNRKSKRFMAPAVLKNEGGEIAEWIPAYAEALTEILRVIPYPLDALGTLPRKAMLEFGATINSQAQLELIEHHATDEDLPMQTRAHCQRWVTLVKASSSWSNAAETDR